MLRSSYSGWEPGSSRWEETHVPKVVSSNPSTVYWINIYSHLSVVKIVMCVRKGENKRKIGRAGVGPFSKIVLFYWTYWPMDPLGASNRHSKKYQILLYFHSQLKGWGFESHFPQSEWRKIGFVDLKAESHDAWILLHWAWYGKSVLGQMRNFFNGGWMGAKASWRKRGRWIP